MQADWALNQSICCFQVSFKLKAVVKIDSESVASFQESKLTIHVTRIIQRFSSSLIAGLKQHDKVKQSLQHLLKDLTTFKHTPIKKTLSVKHNLESSILQDQGML
jgi:hypothetical protein